MSFVVRVNSKLLSDRHIENTTGIASFSTFKDIARYMYNNIINKESESKNDCN